MVDLSDTIAPKSNQLNADDLLGGLEITVTIERVQKTAGDQQPITIHLAGGRWKPWKPCLGMRRVLIQVWGADGGAYVGRQVRLFRDPDVLWGGKKSGGIRIQAMSHLPNDKPATVTVTLNKNTRVEVLIDALPTPKPPPPDPVKTAIAEAMRAERWNKEQVTTLLGSVGATKAADVPADKQAEVIAALGGAAPTAGA